MNLSILTGVLDPRRMLDNDRNFDVLCIVNIYATIQKGETGLEG